MSTVCPSTYLMSICQLRPLSTVSLRPCVQASIVKQGQQEIVLRSPVWVFKHLNREVDLTEIDQILEDSVQTGSFRIMAKKFEISRSSTRARTLTLSNYM